MYGNLMDIDVRQGGLRDGCRGLASLDGLASVFLSFLRSFLVGHYIALPAPPAAVCAVAPPLARCHRSATAMMQCISSCDRPESPKTICS